MPAIRVELALDFGPSKGRVISEVVEPSHSALVKVLQNKLKLRKKESAQVTLCSVDSLEQRLQLPAGDLSEVLQNGAKVVACLGEPSAQSAPAALPPKVRKALDELRLVPAGRGSLSARGRPNGQTVAALQQQLGVTAVVTLMRHDEGPGAAESVGSACERLGLRWCHAPLAGPKEMGMTGLGVATLRQEDLESFRKALEVKAWLESGDERVVVHCSAGLHRTGIWLYVLLRTMGEAPDDALQKIGNMRRATHDEFVRLGFRQKAEGIVAHAIGEGADCKPASLVRVLPAGRRAECFEGDPNDVEADEDGDAID